MSDFQEVGLFDVNNAVTDSEACIRDDQEIVPRLKTITEVNDTLSLSSWLVEFGSNPNVQQCLESVTQKYQVACQKFEEFSAMDKLREMLKIGLTLAEAKEFIATGILKMNPEVLEKIYEVCSDAPIKEVPAQAAPGFFARFMPSVFAQEIGQNQITTQAAELERIKGLKEEIDKVLSTSQEKLVSNHLNAVRISVASFTITQSILLCSFFLNELPEIKNFSKESKKKFTKIRGKMTDMFANMKELVQLMAEFGVMQREWVELGGGGDSIEGVGQGSESHLQELGKTLETKTESLAKKYKKVHKTIKKLTLDTNGTITQVRTARRVMWTDGIKSLAKALEVGAGYFLLYKGLNRGQKISQGAGVCLLLALVGAHAWGVWECDNTLKSLRSILSELEELEEKSETLRAQIAKAKRFLDAYYTRRHNSN